MTKKIKQGEERVETNQEKEQETGEGSSVLAPPTFFLLPCLLCLLSTRHKQMQTQIQSSYLLLKIERKSRLELDSSTATTMASLALPHLPLIGLSLLPPPPPQPVCPPFCFNSCACSLEPRKDNGGEFALLVVFIVSC
jgi:hypothetical protein